MRITQQITNRLINKKLLTGSNSQKLLANNTCVKQIFDHACQCTFEHYHKQCLCATAADNSKNVYLSDLPKLQCMLPLQKICNTYQCTAYCTAYMSQHLIALVMFS